MPHHDLMPDSKPMIRTCVHQSYAKHTGRLASLRLCEPGGSHTCCPPIPLPGITASQLPKTRSIRLAHMTRRSKAGLKTLFSEVKDIGDVFQGLQ